jgi:tetratricopeptide (TPR) repeat protein
MRYYLGEAEKTNAKVDDDDASGRILGFRALLAHLQSNFDEADRLYEEAIQELRASRNARAGSYFLSHRTALEVSLGRFGQAEEAARSCRALAETAGYPDLIAYASLASGQIFRARKQFVKANNELHSALREATRLDLGCLQAEILTEHARLALDLGDSALARQRALEALQISNSHSLGLRRSHSLLVLGLATVKAAQRKLGITYLQQAREIAESQEYWLCRREATEHLEELGALARPDESPVPDS